MTSGDTGRVPRIDFTPEPLDGPPGPNETAPPPPDLRLPRSPTDRIPAWVYDEAARAQATGTRPNFGPFVEDGPGNYRPHFVGGTSDPVGRFHLPGHPDAPRRSLASRLVGIGVAVAIGLALVFVSADALRTTRVPPELLGSYAERTDLPPPLAVAPAANRPSPGFGEERAPLGTPPEVDRSSESFAHQLSAPSSNGDVPVMWSPCRPIHYVVTTADAPEDFLLRVTDVVAEVSAATGLVFAYDGTTTEPVAPGREPFLPLLYGNRWAPVLIGWADAEQDPALEGNIAGLAYVQPATDRVNGTTHFVSGQVVLDTAMARDPGTRGWYDGVLRHELAHLAGLDHVEDERQLMAASPSVNTFRDGDLAGLATLGSGACAPGL